MQTVEEGQKRSRKKPVHVYNENEEDDRKKQMAFSHLKQHWNERNNGNSFTQNENERLLKKKKEFTPGIQIYTRSA